MANKAMLKFHGITQKKFNQLNNTQKRDLIQEYVSTTQREKREAVTQKIADKVEDARFRAKNPFSTKNVRNIYLNK